MNGWTFESAMQEFINASLLTPDQYEQIKQDREVSGFKPLVKKIADEGIAEEKILSEFIVKTLGYTPVQLWKFEIKKEYLDLISKEVAIGKNAVPLHQIEDILTVAMSDPWEQQIIDEIKAEAGCQQVCAVYANPQEILEAAEKLYGDTYESELRNVLEEIQENDLELIEAEGDDGGSMDKSILLSLTDQEPVVRLTKSILYEGVRRKASDIFIEPDADELVIRYRVDGVLQDGPHPPKSMHQGVISRLKIISELDIAEQRLPQDGRLKLNVDKRNIEFRLSTIPSYFGEKACLRILDPQSMSLKLDNLGYDEQVIATLRKAASCPYGMILICGPTGSGKTTTLYSILNHLDAPTRNLVTVEDPVEYHIDGVNQVNVRADVGLTFEAALRSILRQDPDVVLIGEIRDQKTVDIAVKAALTGHIVLSTLHTNSAVGTITRLLNMGVEPFLATAALILVGSQRLLRRLCPECKEPFQADATHCKALNIKEEPLKLYKSKGCESCQGTGYKGRISVIELLTISPSIRELILKHANEHELKKAARAEGMKTLREAAVDKVVSGETSIDEAFRVTMKDDTGAS
ncbi:MAG: type II/IV secretion system protein [Candidatus Omnitrophica bacterium]|nr:type II/IV secretion system protein [Candidatus Omnitrophota bacterium]